MSETIKQITPNLWIQQSEYFATNSGIFMSDGEACLIDPNMNPDEIKAIANFINSQNVALKSIILTHDHWDHVLGPAHFPNVKVIAHTNYLQGGVEQIKHIQEQILDWQKRYDLKPTPNFDIPMPDEKVEDGHTLNIGSETLEFVHVAGHAPDQIAIFHKASGTFWAADTLSNIEIPFVSHSLSAYENTLAKVSKLDIKVLIPGHGEDGHTLNIGSETLEFVHVAGHAPDQIAIFHKASGTFWAADTLSNIEIPFVSHSLSAYENTLAKVSKLDIKVLIPGHGEVTKEPTEIKTRITEDSAYLTELREKVSGIVDCGGVVEDCIDSCLAMSFKNPEANKDEHRMNVESAFLELGGKADGRKLGWG